MDLTDYNTNTMDSWVDADTNARQEELELGPVCRDSAAGDSIGHVIDAAQVRRRGGGVVAMKHEGRHAASPPVVGMPYDDGILLVP